MTNESIIKELKNITKLALEVKSGITTNQLQRKQRNIYIKKLDGIVQLANHIATLTK